MYARVASFQGGDEQRLEQMNRERQESGTMNPPEGIKRVMLLSDRNGKRLFISFFETREEIEAAEQRFESMGDEVPEDVRGKRTGVDVYEVVWEDSM